MIDVILGLQWGDEGKGKIVDFLAPEYDAVARFQGGPNAGHSIVVQGKKHVLHNIPSGVYHEGKINLIGNGVLVDPIAFAGEVSEVSAAGFELHSRLYISNRAHLILPSHRLVDEAQELLKGDLKIGSTKKGIGPAYTDRTSRQGIRAGEIFLPDFPERYARLKAIHGQIFQQLGLSLDPETEERWFGAIEEMKKFAVLPTEYLLQDLLRQGKSILAEGAQGSLLDVDFGTYPFVTSSNTTTGGVCTGLGVPPSAIRKVSGVFKAYCTRVGSGPFPSELFDEPGPTLQRIGNEIGATTGRARRCGWIDLVALNYAVMVNGCTDLIMTKSDVFDSFESILAGVAYQVGDSVETTLPLDLNSVSGIVWEEFPGWEESISAFTHVNELPEELNYFMDFIENQTNTPISIISVGPDRVQTIRRVFED